MLTQPVVEEVESRWIWSEEGFDISVFCSFFYSEAVMWFGKGMEWKKKVTSLHVLSILFYDLSIQLYCL